MPYEHDVFISYKRSRLRNEWIAEHFIPLFWDRVQEGIADACDRDPDPLFFDETGLDETTRGFDQRGIEPGENWRTALRGAIRQSRCLIALCSPMYWRSPWCQVEWRSFRHRSDTCGRSLVIPVIVHNGSSFPEDARNLEPSVLSDYVIVGEGFKRTPKYVEFQEHLRGLAAVVARAVAAAPAYQEWDVADAGVAPIEAKIPKPSL